MLLKYRRKCLLATMTKIYPLMIPACHLQSMAPQSACLPENTGKVKCTEERSIQSMLDICDIDFPACPPVRIPMYLTIDSDWFPEAARTTFSRRASLAGWPLDQSPPAATPVSKSTQNFALFVRLITLERVR